MNALFNSVGLLAVFVGATWSIVDEVRDRSFWRNRGQWLFLIGFLFLIVPRYGWAAGIACDVFWLIAIALYRTKWWTWTKATEFGSYVYENSIGRLVNWPKRTELRKRDGADEDN